MSWLTDQVFGQSVIDKQQNKNGDGHGDSNATVSNSNNVQHSAAMANGSTSDGGHDAGHKAQEILPPIDISHEKKEVAAEWRVPLRGKLHKIELEHGTTSGKRVLWIDEKEIFRRDWMFKLVGDDVFQLEGVRCVLRVDPAPSFKYKYSLFVDGKPLDQFKQRQAKALRIWECRVNDKDYRVVLEKDTLNIFVNGLLREEEGEFVDIGTETKWEGDENVFVLTARTSGNKHEGLLHSLTVNGNKIEEVSIDV